MKSAHPAAARFPIMFSIVSLVSMERKEKFDSYMFAKYLSKHRSSDVKIAESMLAEMTRDQRISLVRKMGF